MCGRRTDRPEAATAGRADSSSSGSRPRESSSCDPRSSRQEGSDAPPPGSISSSHGRDRGAHRRPARSRQASDLDRLYPRLTDPDRGSRRARGRSGQIRAYVSSRYEVCMGDRQQQPPRAGSNRPAARSGLLLPAGSQNVLRARLDGRSTGAGDYRPYVRAVLDMTTAGARSLAAALDDARPTSGRPACHYRIEAPGPNRAGLVGFEPYLPHGETHCSVCGWVVAAGVERRSGFACSPGRRQAR